MKHIVLLGDSIFDNLSYVNFGELDVPNQLRSLVGHRCRVTNLAVDGHKIGDIKNQLSNIPPETTNLFVSIGGNDGLGHLSIFNSHINTVGEALQQMYRIGSNFKKKYSEMVDLILSYNIPTAFCSIYYPRFDASSLTRVQHYMKPFQNSREIQEMTMAAETIFNDIITYEIFKRKIPLIDLRVLCDDNKDFANPIEPSCIGGMKIAKTISFIADIYDTGRKHREVYV
tara:strand:+ start:279 stop:962 length:684 start_codon:yes stop_codon:yes gene_type:complete